MKVLKYTVFVIIQLLFINMIIAQNKIVQEQTILNAAGKFVIGVRPDAWNTTVDKNPKNEEIVRTEFNAIQPTCYPFQWISEDNHNLVTFTKWVEWGRTFNKTIMMHMLIGWNNFGPTWFVKGNWSKLKLDELLEKRIKAVVYPFKDDQIIWNVVNESLRGWEDKGLEAGKYRVDSACVWNRLGWEADASGLSGTDKINDSIPVYIRKSFEITQKYTNAPLELRDYMFDFANANDRKLLAFYQLAKHLLNKGVRLDAVGFQCHITGTTAFDVSTKNWTNFQNNINKFKMLGLKVYLTEVDISAESYKTIPFTDELALKQKEAYKQLVQQAILAKVDGLFFWGVADGVDKGWYPYHKPLLYDENFNKKPAYYGVLEALSADSNTNGLNNLTQNKITIFPTSSKDGVFTMVGKNMDKSSIYITDALGRAVSFKTIEHSAEKRIFQLESKSTGLYLLKIMNGLNIVTQKIYL